MSNAEYKALPKLPIILVVDNVRSMHNIGSLFRTSDAFKVEEIVLGGISGCPPHPEISKTALGAEYTVSWRHVKDTLPAVSALQSKGWKICVLEQAHGSISLEAFHPDISSGKEDDKGLVLVVGNEVKGVDQAIVDMADYILEIPQEGTKHSLNVAASGAIALFHLYNLIRPLSLKNSTLKDK